MRDFSRTEVIALLFLMCASTAAGQEKEDKDDIGDRIVKETELWPAKIEVPEGVETKELVYARRGDTELDLTYFTRKEPSHRRPAILFVHGGSWKHGDKRQFYRQAAYLTQEYKQSIAMTERLQHYGVDAELEIYPGKGHAWFNREPDREITTKRLAEFIEKHFKKKTPKH